MYNRQKKHCCTGWLNNLSSPTCGALRSYQSRSREEKKTQGGKVVGTLTHLFKDSANLGGGGGGRTIVCILVWSTGLSMLKVLMIVSTALFSLKKRVKVRLLISLDTVQPLKMILCPC